MDGLPGYVNIDGYQSLWTQNWYRYERAPTCPDCGSPYLTCDPVRDVCVSVERTVVQTDRGLESTQEVANLVIGQKFVGPVERTVVQTDRGLESTQEVANLVIGQKFAGPGDDPGRRLVLQEWHWLVVKRGRYRSKLTRRKYLAEQIQINEL
ncbi:hypothetical protein DPMN_154240 [Dreissena polymorpha]|uniref:Uncharacterized protein n=1 Tax=Dreissena polymorpha TaxID=45954 RepID=A0A9D4FKR2_DREPO|nr:hypothetical protein DPMN_154240 [Dreissena polymorpha]